MSTFKKVFETARSSEAYWVGRVKFQVAAALHDLLETSQWTQDRLASTIGVKAPQVSRALGGSHNTTIESLAKMGFALGYVPQVTFVPVNSKAEVFSAAFNVDFQVRKKSMKNVYSFDTDQLLPKFTGDEWTVSHCSNDQRFALAA